MKFRGPSSSRRSARPSELLHRLRIAFAVLFATTSVGTTGYMILGLSFVDALYQTVITVSTVGFRELGTADQIDTDYKFFTIVLIMVGAGAVLYTLGVLIETLIEGRLSEEFGRRRMQRTIEDLSNHVIVCGWGQVGQSIAGTLTGEGHDVVVVDRRDKGGRRAICTWWAMPPTMQCSPRPGSTGLVLWLLRSTPTPTTSM